MNNLSQDIAERIEEEREHNGRYALGLKIQYDQRLPGNRSTRRSFLLANYSYGYSVKQIFNSAYDAAIRNNPNFENHLPYIIGMNFSVTGFSNDRPAEVHYVNVLMIRAELQQEWDEFTSSVQ
jgi:hypothetical protein